MAKIILEIEKCWDGCPYCTPRFGGCGDADDWRCKGDAKKLIVI